MGPRQPGTTTLSLRMIRKTDQGTFPWPGGPVCQREATITEPMSNHRTVSIKDVAKVAGVGLATVSRVINDGPGVSPSMRQRVTAAIRSTGYLPINTTEMPPTPGAPGTRTRQTIEVIYQQRFHLGCLSEVAPVFEAILEGFEDAAAAVDLELSVRRQPIDGGDWPVPDPRCIGRLYFGRQPGQMPPDTYQHLLPSVWVLGQPESWFDGDEVYLDHPAVGTLAAREVLRLGHRDCLIVGTANGSPLDPSSARCQSFMTTFAAEGGTSSGVFNARFLIADRQTNRIDQELLAEVLERHLQDHGWPGAIFVQADMFLPNLYKVLGKALPPGQRMPLVISANNEPRYRRRLDPKPVIIDIHAEATGRLAVETLAWRLRHPKAPARRMSLRPTVLT